MKTALRAILALVAGMALALVLVIAVEFFSAVVHPLPPGFTGTMDEMCQHVARYPHWVLGVVVLAWSATAFVSTWVATRIGNRLAGIAVILILTLAIVSNVSMLPYAMWFKVVMLSCFPVACYLGGMREYRCPRLRPTRLQSSQLISGITLHRRRKVSATVASLLEISEVLDAVSSLTTSPHGERN